MQTTDRLEIEKAKKSALEVLRHNAHGPYHGLPRTAGWGYPEPYTRDLMFSIFGIAVTEDPLNGKYSKSTDNVAQNHDSTGTHPFLGAQ